ncbi:MAG: Mur ligase family protein [Pseudomonadota bacterium]
MGPFFFCGIGGSGMMPLALILKGQGITVSGSDRSNDQGRTPEKFTFLKSQGISIVPQDGLGLTTAYSALVVSSAIEDSIPEVQRAKAIGVPIIKRAELLAQIFDAAHVRIAVGGTSGKSTTTGMLAWILSEYGKNPTVMNGANFLNFVSPQNAYATALVGDEKLFVAECDESDGSIVLYHPTIAVLTNVALDHKPIDDLLPIFDQYLKQSNQVVLNITNNAVKSAFVTQYREKSLIVSLSEADGADIIVTNIIPSLCGSMAEIKDVRTGEGGLLTLQIPGRHNVENALCAIGAAVLAGVPFMESVRLLSRFLGVVRRLQTIKTINNISVIDDFAHNPDKVEASLKSLHETDGRLLIMFQMHGYGPFRLMKDPLLQSFAAGLNQQDIFYMPDVLYLGGSVDKSYTAADFTHELKALGVNACHVPLRADIAQLLRDEAKSGDRIVIMGARDDTLTDFAKSIFP